MANIFDTAKYIIQHSGKNGAMSTMKLQKLCYYAQAWSLVWDDAELFPEDFEAWTNGPVCRELFVRTRGKFSATVEDEYGGQEDLTDEQIDTINTVLDFYAPHDAQWLSSLTHMEDPWKKAREGIADGMECHKVITKASMAEYYGGL